MKQTIKALFLILYITFLSIYMVGSMVLFNWLFESRILVFITWVTFFIIALFKASYKFIDLLEKYKLKL